MQLPIKESLQQISASCWRAGSMVIERGSSTTSPDTIVEWTDKDVTYRLRPSKSEDTDSASTDASGEVKLVHEGGTLSAVWQIGRRAFCKVHPWKPQVESEAATIAFVKQAAPYIPTPNVIHKWCDKDRSFLIVERLGHSTLNDAWGSLSTAQRNLAVEVVALFCQRMATNTSHLLSSVTGKCVGEPYLDASGSELVGPLTADQCRGAFSTSTAACPAIDRFHFYHADLGPTNIMVSEDGIVEGVIDWESAGFYPEFWIATKPSVSPGLDLCPAPAGCDELDWRRALKTELERLGFPQANMWFMEWLESNEEKCTEAADDPS
ncbi:MAG: hypothetical protein LQ346_005321 [Caloplaca aetnensis]|nr:MAG: hypothetical protein LQ346_005321 [Caloplaca aetnensis]